MTSETREPRRRQADRTAAARQKFIEAAIELISDGGYKSATTAAIAERAGISRTNITFHFGSRAKLMATIVREVFKQELTEYRQLGFLDEGTDPSQWPDLLWRVLSKPSGIAVLEILLASRSDADLADQVKPLQSRIEGISFAFMQSRLHLGEAEIRALGMLLVWAVRGLTVAKVLVDDPGELRASVNLLRFVLDGVAATVASRPDLSPPVKPIHPSIERRVSSLKKDGPPRDKKEP